MLRNTPSWTGLSRLLILSLMLGGGLTTTASAQSRVPSVEAGKPFKVAFDHDGLNVTHFRLLLNGAQVAELPASARVNGSVTVDMPPLTIGAYSLVAVARNAPSAPFTDPVESASVAYAFEVRTTAPTPTRPMWRETSILLADGRRLIESITPVTLDELPETLRLLADGTTQVVR